MKYAALIKHGCSRKGAETPEYRIWLGIRKRCNNSNSSIWRYYGGRGVSLCSRWEDFANFLADMGPRPSEGHSIDRIDVNGHYEPSNCRWATKQEQMRNKRDNRLLEFRGESRCVTEWAEVLGLNLNTVRRRVKEGLPVDRILAPSRPYRRAA